MLKQVDWDRLFVGELYCFLTENSYSTFALYHDNISKFCYVPLMYMGTDMISLESQFIKGKFILKDRQCHVFMYKNEYCVVPITCHDVELYKWEKCNIEELKRMRNERDAAWGW